MYKYKKLVSARGAIQSFYTLHQSKKEIERERFFFHFI